MFVESWLPGSGGSGQILSIDLDNLGSDVIAESSGGCHGFDYSPDANSIVFIDGGGHDLRITNLDSGRTAISHHEPEGAICGPPSISRCGSRIAYWSIWPSIANRYLDDYVTIIFALDVDPISCEPMGGPWIVEAYPRRKGRDWEANHRDGIHVNHPQINPVNKDHICYSHEMLGATPDGSVAMCRLWNVMADGSGNSHLVRQPAGLHFTHEVIAPDGHSLIFPYMHGVGQVDFDTLGVRSIYYNPDCCPGHLTVSPDGKWIAGDTWSGWTDDEGRAVQSVMMFEVETRRFAHLAWIPRSGGHPGHPHPSFSPDGGRIAFTFAADGGYQVGCIDVREVQANWESCCQGVGRLASPDWIAGFGN